jgi:hypothetical protein
MAVSLEAAGLSEIRTEILEMAPVAAACVLGRESSSRDASDHSRRGVGDAISIRETSPSRSE